MLSPERRFRRRPDHPPAGTQAVKMNTLNEETLPALTGVEPGLLTRHDALVGLVPGVRRNLLEAATASIASVAEQPVQRVEPTVVDLDHGGGLAALLGLTLRDAIELTAGDFGNIQLLNPASGALEIVAHSGFGAEFLEHFAFVDFESHSACGRAAYQGVQAVIDDVQTDPDFRPNREIAESSGFRAVQSTPLIDRGGALIGVLSTHFERPGHPLEQDLRMMRAYGRLAGEALSQALRTAAVERAAAELPALLESWPQQRPGGVVNSHARLSGDAVERLFGVSIDLADAYACAGDASLRYRIANAVADIDTAIRQIRTVTEGNGG